MTQRTWWMVVFAGIMLWWVAGPTSRCEAAEVNVHLTQVKASNEGPESVDPALGDLGQRLKEKYRYQNFKLVGTSSRATGEGASAEFELANGMRLIVKVVAVKGNNIELNLAVGSVASFTVNVRNGGTFLTTVPWGKDMLVLAIRPIAQ